eukprot:scaffold125422_cov24-Tisochrysis_lutea.AAC.1
MLSVFSAYVPVLAYASTCSLMPVLAQACPSSCKLMHEWLCAIHQHALQLTQGRYLQLLHAPHQRRNPETRTRL